MDKVYTPDKPYSESCDQNCEPILGVIKPLLSNTKTVLEIGSGTGQHAVFFAQQMPHLIWQPSDCAQYLPGIKLWLDEARLENTRNPHELDVMSDWPSIEVDAVFSANTAHIMHWPEVEALFAGVGGLLPEQGRFMLYGPFNYDQQYTSESNERFDQWLKQRDPLSGVRNFEDINHLAAQAGLTLTQDYAMPANNRILFWEKQT